MRAATGRRTSLRIAAAVAGLVLVASGCADRSSNSAQGTLKLGQVSNSAAFLPIYIARQKGYFEKEGVKVGKPPILGTGAKVAAAVKSGSVDAGASVMPDVLNLQASGTDAQMVSNLVDKYYVDVVVGKNFHGPGTSAPLKDRIKALKGKKIGITGPGSGTEALLVYLFKQAGMNAKTDAQLVNLGGQVTAAIGALKTGRVDALSYAQPTAQMVETKKIGTNYISPVRGDVPSLKNVTQGVVYTTKATAGKKKKEIAAFQRGVVDALKFIHSDPKSARKLIGQYLNSTSEATLNALIPILEKEMPDKPGFPRASFEASLRFNKETGLIEKVPTYEQLVPKDLQTS